MPTAKRVRYFAVLLLGTLLMAAQASARDETLRWTHEAPGTVDKYRVYWGTAPGDYTSQTDVGIPSLDGEGAHVYDLQVPNGATIYVVVTAWTDDLESDLSNERMRAPASVGKPGRPELVLD